jgi:hypothetical protein
MARLDPTPINRRSFLSLASLGSFFVALGTAAAGMLRLPNPAVLPGPVRRFKLGSPEQFAVGSETAFGEQKLVLFRDDDVFYAISSTCNFRVAQLGSVTSVTWPWLFGRSESM